MLGRAIPQNILVALLSAIVSLGMEHRGRYDTCTNEPPGFSILNASEQIVFRNPTLMAFNGTPDTISAHSLTPKELRISTTFVASPVMTLDSGKLDLSTLTNSRDCSMRMSLSGAMPFCRIALVKEPVPAPSSRMYPELSGLMCRTISLLKADPLGNKAPSCKGCFT